jgi:hypothetical protein
MNPVERVLDDEVSRLIDRLASSVPGGSLAAMTTLHPGLRARVDQVEAGLADVRGALLEAYGRWQRGLEDLENVWALAAWRSTAAEEPAQTAAPLAA